MRQPDFIYYLLAPLVKRTLALLEQRGLIEQEDYDKEETPAKAPKKTKQPAQPVASLAAQEAEITKAEWPQFEGLGLTLNQQRFVLCYTRPDIAFNATRAYIEAYDLDRVDDYLTATSAASALLRNHKVQRAISIELDRQLGNHDLLAKRVLTEWTKLAFLDITELLEITGPFVYLKKIEELPAHFRPAVRSIENTQSGIKVTFHDKNKALESIAKCLGMFTENQRVVDEKYETLVQRLAREEAEQNAQEKTQ